MRADQRVPHAMCETEDSLGRSACYPLFQHHSYILELNSPNYAESNDHLVP